MHIYFSNGVGIQIPVRRTHLLVPYPSMLITKFAMIKAMFTRIKNQNLSRFTYFQTTYDILTRLKQMFIINLKRIKVNNI